MSCLLWADLRPVVAVAALMLIYLLAHSVIRSYRRAIVGSAFFSRQVRSVRWLARTKLVQEMWRPEPQWRASDVEPFTKAQVTLFAQRVSTGIVVHRLQLVLASKVDDYRRTVLPQFVEYLAVVGLLLTTTISFALVDAALYRLEPAQFQVAGDVTFVTFLLLAATGMAGGSTASIAAVGVWSQSLSALNLLFGLAAIGAGFLGVVRNWRSRRDEEVSRLAVLDLEAEAAEMQREFAREYGVSIDEALRRLGTTTRVMLGTWLDWLSAQLPRDSSQKY